MLKKSRSSTADMTSPLRLLVIFMHPFHSNMLHATEVWSPDTGVVNFWERCEIYVHLNSPYETLMTGEEGSKNA